MAEPRQRIRYWSQAFTLAEVLITLAIIGIVAALTIPSLISAYKKKVIETKLVHFYSTFNQALNRAKVDYGDFSQWKLLTYESTEDDVKSWHETYIKPYIKVAKTEYETIDSTPRIIDYLNNGSVVVIGFESWMFFPDSKDFKLLVVGEDGEQYNYPDRKQSGISWFTFLFRPNYDNVYHKNRGLEPYKGDNFDGTKEYLINDSALGCNAQNDMTRERAYCAALIQMNNWKIPDDYFYNF